MEDTNENVQKNIEQEIMKTFKLIEELEKMQKGSEE